MKIYLWRQYRRPNYTIGHLYIDGKYVCDTVEDTDRNLTDAMPLDEIRKKKISNETAIPCGTYPVVFSISTRFRSRDWASVYGGIVPLVDGVKCYQGVRIHPGNKAEDTEGCLLPGQNKVKGGVINSKETYLRIMDQYLWPAYKRQDKVFITISPIMPNFLI